MDAVLTWLDCLLAWNISFLQYQEKSSHTQALTPQGKPLPPRSLPGCLWAAVPSLSVGSEHGDHSFLGLEIGHAGAATNSTDPMSRAGLHPDSATTRSLRQEIVSVPWLPYLQNGVYSSSSSWIVRRLDRSVCGIFLEDCLA